MNNFDCHPEILAEDWQQHVVFLRLITNYIVQPPSMVTILLEAPSGFGRVLDGHTKSLAALAFKSLHNTTLSVRVVKSTDVIYLYHPISTRWAPTAPTSYEHAA